MSEASLRAARPERKGGLSNALFAVAAAEALPPELRGRAAEVTIHFPWGSLLRATLALEDAETASRGISSLLAAGGRVRTLVSIDLRDGLGIEPLAPSDGPVLGARWATCGLELIRFAPADAVEIRATGSSWARRLGAGRDRVAWAVELRSAPLANGCQP